MLLIDELIGRELYTVLLDNKMPNIINQGFIIDQF